MTKSKIAFTGGGTGGHIYPNLALIEEINGEDTELFYFANPDKLEEKLVNSEELKDFKGSPYKAYLEFVPVNSEALLKSLNPIKHFEWFKNFRKNTAQAKLALVEKEIDLVFGTGGYVAGPVFSACKELKIPYIIHNLDAHMGLANRAFVRGAEALTLGVCDLKQKPRNGKTYVTGNPVSKKFLAALEKEKVEDGKLHLLITGGSQGAQSINDAIGELLEEFSKFDIEIIHITGKKNYDKHLKKFLSKKEYPFYKVLDYTHDMPDLCHWADIAICRSGAMTVAEMLASQTLCIFIPLPWAAHDHQTKNALAISDQGAAITLDQDQEDLKIQILDIIEKAIKDKKFMEEYKEKINTKFEKTVKASTNQELIKIIKENLPVKKC